MGSSACLFECAAERELELAQRVPDRLGPTEQAVERRDVTADGGGAEDVRLHERRTRTGEGVVDAIRRREVTFEEDLDQLRDELAEIRMEAVHVLRALDLRKLVLGP